MKYLEPPTKRRAKVITDMPIKRRADSIIMRIAFALLFICLILGLSHIK